MSQPINVLILEDSEDDTLLLIRKLRQSGYDPTWERVESQEGMKSALEKRSWDILISDHSMPYFSAITALELLKERNIDLPVIIVSGTIGEDIAVKAMKAGASDYIMKDNLTRLIPAIERELREAETRKKTKQLEEQFRQAQKMEAIGRLAGGIAHDFNNLLTTILASCSFLLGHLGFKDTNRKDVQEIKDAGERAALLTRQLLAFSRKQILDLKVLDLNLVVQNMEKLLKRLIGEDVLLVTHLAVDLGKIKADHSQIEQVIMNLAVNARDAMPRGGKITIETVNVNLSENIITQSFDIKPGPYVLLSMSDTGSGMSKETLSHLFEPFFTTKELGKGTGLGLSTVYGIIKQSAGYILVDSALGQGTTFKIYLPLVQDIPETPTIQSAPIKSLKGSETILLVEDEDPVRRVISRVLKKSGYSVMELSNGTEAIAFAKRYKGTIHLVLTDTIMPGMSGRELVEQLTQFLSGIKVIFMSGYTDDIIAQHRGILEKGVNFIEKPFEPKSLLQKIRKVLDENTGI